ncbi:MAG: fibronectin type III domain-containing protein [Flavobacterium sp.]
MRKITFLLFFLFCVSSIHAQVVAYAFNQESGTYTEISGGVAVGTETTDDQRFVDPAVPAGGTILTGIGLPIGFDFTFNSKVYDRFAINANGWISLGMSSLGANAVNVNTTSAYTPLTTTVTTVSNDLVARISPLGRDLAAQAGATLRYETMGTAPNRVLIVQWKNYKKFGTNGDGDAFNFQIKLFETSNVVEFVYGSMVSNANSSTYQVGLRAEPNNVASNFVSRTSTTSWLTTTASIAVADAVTMVNTIVPSNGLIFRWTPPVCAAASGITVNVLTNNTADLEWAAPTPAPAEGYEYVVSTTPTLPTAPGTASAVNTLSLTGLTSNTLYYVYTRTVCDATNNIYGNWILSGTFRTLCDGLSDWQENFDGLPSTGTTVIPACWSIAGTTGSSYVTTGGIAPGSAPNRYYMFSAANAVANAILPPFSNLSAGTHRLKFKGYATVAGRQVRVGYLTNPTNPNTFTLIQTVTLPGTTAATATEFTIIPGALPANATNLMLQIGDPSVSVTSYYDDFKWEVNSSCEAPIALTLSSISDSAATLSWTPSGSETEWEVQYGPLGFALGTGTIVSGLTSTTLPLTGLTASTTYQFYVRAICTPGDPTPWSNVRNFTTLCAPVTEWTENFDAITSTGVNVLPSCWGRGGSSLSSYVTTGSVAPMSPSNRFYTFASFTATPPTTAYTVLPPVSNLELGTHRLRFKGYATALDKFIDVGYYTSAANVNTFVLIQTIPLPATAATSAEEFFIEIPPLPAGVLCLGLRNQPNATSATIYLDDFRYEPIPTCQNPTFLTATNITNTQAQLQWTSNAGEFEWDIKYGAPGFNPLTEGTLVSAIFDNPYILTGLTGATTYSYYVRAVCDSNSNDVSPWEGPFNFTTKCDPVSSYYSDFEPFVTGVNSLPNCWGRIGNSTSTYLTTGSVAPMSPTKRMYMFASGTANPPTTGYAVLPAFDNLSAGTHRFRFTAYATSNGASIGLGYLTNPDDPGTFVLLSNIPLPGTAAANAQEITFEVPNTVPAGVEYLALRNQPPAGTSYTIYYDNVAWEAIPTCPNPTAPVASGVTATQATLSWNASVNNTSWEIEYGPTGFTQGTGTIVPASTNPFVLTGLTPQTTYQFYVRGVCAGPENSVWSAVTSFTTACAPFTPFYSESFSTFTSSATPPPSCWSRADLGNTTTGPQGGTTNNFWWGGNWRNTAGTPNGTAARFNIYTTNRQGWLISPVFDMSAGGYQVKYEVASTTFAGPGPITGGAMGSDDQFVFMISTDGGATWTTQELFNAANTPPNLGTTKTYDLSTITSANVRFAFFADSGATATGDYDVFVDNFVIESIPQNAPVCATNVQATQDASCGNFPVTISWDAVAGADGYKIIAGTTSGGTDIANNVDLGNVTSFVYSNANAATTYYFTIIPFNMVGDAIGCTEQSFTTAAAPCACTPIYSTGVTSGDRLVNFEIASTTLANNSGTTNTNPYSFYPASTGANFTATLTEATSYPINVTVGFTNQAFAVWIDFNDNATFEASELVGFTTTNVIGTTLVNNAFSIQIPCGANPGLHRMRVRMVYAGVGNTIDPCTSYTFGETEDYEVTIAALAVPSGDAVQNITAPTAPDATLASLVVTPANVTWYASEADAIANVNALPLSTELVDGTTYWAVNRINNCSSAPFGVTVTVTLGLDGNQLYNLSYYPNPVKDVLNLVNNTTIERVEIYNLLGQQVMQVRTNTAQASVQVGELAKGAYIVKAYADGAEHTFKIIKN